MKTVEEILMSGVVYSSLNRTSQTVDSNVYSILFLYEDNGQPRSLSGYVQVGNTNKNAIINGKPFHAFDCSIMDYTPTMVAEAKHAAKRSGVNVDFVKI